jgi:hypothetical protein
VTPRDCARTSDGILQPPDCLRNNGAINNPANARWTSHHRGQIIVLMGRESSAARSSSSAALMIDKPGGSINGSDRWQLVQTIKLRRKLLT